MRGGRGPDRQLRGAKIETVKVSSGSSIQWPLSPHRIGQPTLAIQTFCNSSLKPAMR
jgi:hypothetical protein